MKLPNEHDGAMVNGSVRLELRGVATGVSATAWQLACEGVRAREHARAPFGQGEQGSTPSGAGVREQNAGGERERPGTARQSRWLRRHGLRVLAPVRSPVCTRQRRAPAWHGARAPKRKGRPRRREQEERWLGAAKVDRDSALRCLVNRRSWSRTGLARRGLGRVPVRASGRETRPQPARRRGGNRGIRQANRRVRLRKRGRDGQKARPCVHPHDVYACASVLGCTIANKTRGKDRAARFDKGDTIVRARRTATRSRQGRSLGRQRRLGGAVPRATPTSLARAHV
jgi:hypothetical protein